MLPEYPAPCDRPAESIISLGRRRARWRLAAVALLPLIVGLALLSLPRSRAKYVGRIAVNSREASLR